MGDRDERAELMDVGLKAAEEAASQRLRKEFKLALTRSDFDRAFEQALTRCLIQETAPAHELTALPPEEAMLRIYVQTQINSIQPAMLVGEFAVHDELTSLRAWIDAAILRVKDKVRKRYNTKSIRGSKHLQETATRWAGARAREVLQPYLDMLDEFDRSFALDQECRPKKGRPAVKHDALDNFGLQVVRYFRRGRNPYPEDTYPTLVGLLWVVSGAYRFGYSDDDSNFLNRAIRVAGKRLKTMEKESIEQPRKQPREGDDAGEDLPRPGRPPRGRPNGGR